MNTINQLVARVYKTCFDYKLFSSGDNVLVAVSGGADSVSLLHILVLLQSRLEIKLSVIHLNHGFRGEESDKEELFTKNLSFRLGLPFFSTKKELLNVVKKERGSTQMVARDVRYNYFDEVARNNNFDKIALAHNLDDRVETFFLKVLNGCSPSALALIPFSRNKYVRPLQEISRFEIVEFLKNIKQNFVTDSSNLSNKYQRNFLRNDILPALKGKFGYFEKRIIQLSESIQEENSYWRALFKAQNYWDLKLSSEEISFDLEQMKLAPLVLVKRIISEYSAFISKGKTLPPYSFYAKLDHFLNNKNKNIIWYKGKHLVISTVSARVVMRSVSNNLPLREYEKKLVIGNNQFSKGVIFALELIELATLDKNFFKQDAKNGIFWVSSRKINFNNLKIRYRKNGDFIFIAQNKRKKIKDILIDDKVDKNSNTVFVVESKDEQVAFIVSPNYEKSRVSFSYLASDNNEKLLRLQIKDIGGNYE